MNDISSYMSRLIIEEEGDQKLLTHDQIFNIYAVITRVNVDFVRGFPFVYRLFVPEFLESETQIQNAINFASTYYRELKLYDTDVPIYSIGDSLEKFNFTWNVMRVNQIKQIPLSGNLTDESLDPSIVQRCEDFKRNNRVYQELVDTLQHKDQVIITDYGNTGKSVASLCVMLSIEGIDLRLIKFIIASSNDEFIDQMYGYLGALGISDRLNVVMLDTDPIFFFTNSDYQQYQSRCTPRYPVQAWSDEPEDVWMNPFIDHPNYFLCNLARIMTFVLFSDLL